MAGKESKKKQDLKNQLKSTDVKVLKKAIKSIESNGDPSFVKPLAKLILRNENEQIQKQIIELFSSFKDSGIKPEMIDLLQDHSYLAIRPILLNTIWNTKVDFSDYIDDFVEIASEGDFMEAMECLTIIENLEGPFMEENILESQLHLKNYIESNDSDEQKKAIMSEIALLVKTYNNSLTEL